MFLEDVRLVLLEDDINLSNFLDSNLFIIDYDLGTGKTCGIKICEKIKKERPEAVCVLHTGNLNIEEEYIRCFDGVIWKPTNLKKFVNEVNKYLNI